MGIFTPRRDSDDTFDGESGVAIPKAYNTPRPLTASAVQVSMRNSKEAEQIKARKAEDGWQQEAWEYYDLIGEIKYSSNLISNTLSRINIFPAYVEDSSSVPSSIRGLEDLDEDFRKAAMELVYELESSVGGTSGILRSMALNLFIVGECYLVLEPARPMDGVPASWSVRSIDEIIVVNKEFAIRTRKDTKPKDYIKIGKEGVIRIWRNHPRFSDEADSSLRGLLELCDELLLLSRTTRATARSRLNAGLLFLPDGLVAASSSDGDIDEDGTINADETLDDFVEELMDAMVTPIRDETDSSAVVPFILTGNQDLGEKIRHIAFERSFDPMHVKMAEDRLDRILAGLDIPKDIAQGLSGVKYSNAILIEESLYKAHIEPLILMVVDALTTGYLRPLLLKMGHDPKLVSRAAIWYDPSAITAKPSKAEASTQGYEMGVISAEAWRRAHGFAMSDAPADLERAQRIAEKQGMLSEPLTEMLLNTIIPPDIMAKYRQQSLAQTDPESREALEQVLDPNAPAQEAPAAESAPEEEPPPELINPN